MAKKKAGFITAVQDRARPPHRCGVAKVLAAIEDPGLRREVQQAIDMPELHATAVAAELTARGYPISDQPISRHRRGGCSCSR